MQWYIARYWKQCIFGTETLKSPALQRVLDSPDEGGEDAEDCNCQGSHRALHWPGEVSVLAPRQNDSSNTTD